MVNHNVSRDECTRQATLRHLNDFTGMLPKQPESLQPAECVELNPVDDIAATCQRFCLVRVDDIRLHDLDLERHGLAFSDD